MHTKFLSVVKCLREEKNPSFLKAITRKRTGFENLSEDLCLFCNHLTRYVFKFVQGQIEPSSLVKIFRQNSSNKFKLLAAKELLGRHIATPSSCDGSFFSTQSLPCKHIFKVCALLDIPAFSPSLVHSWWTMECHKGLEQYVLGRCNQDDEDNLPFLPGSWKCLLPGHTLVTTQAMSKNTLISPKFRKGLQIEQTLASLISKGGM